MHNARACPANGHWNYRKRCLSLCGLYSSYPDLHTTRRYSLFLARFSSCAQASLQSVVHQIKVFSVCVYVCVYVMFCIAQSLCCRADTGYGWPWWTLHIPRESHGSGYHNSRCWDSGPMRLWIWSSSKTDPMAGQGETLFHWPQRCSSEQLSCGGRTNT